MKRQTYLLSSTFKISNDRVHPPYKLKTDSMEEGLDMANHILDLKKNVADLVEEFPDLTTLYNLAKI